MLKRFLSKNSPTLHLLLLSACLLASLAGCGGWQAAGPAAAIEAYLQALVSQDADGVTNNSCSNWEADAMTEYNSFAAVTASLEDLSCRETGRDGADAQVSCSGQIVANYNGEDLEIDLSDRIYRVVEEGGDWRMCGYLGSR